MGVFARDRKIREPIYKQKNESKSMEEEKVVLDRKSFEALAVDTRVKILKSLKERRKTLSEIAKEQGMSVSGIKEHLETLEHVGLIEKKDDGHKWKYYELTKKGAKKTRKAAKGLRALKIPFDRIVTSPLPRARETADIVADVLKLEEEVAEAPALRPTEFAQKLAAGKFAVSVEMDPPRGLSTHKLIAGASLLAEAGADVINVADSPMARMRMSAWAVCDVVQRRVNVETTLHFPTRGRNLLRVQGDLLAAHALGIRNVLVIMGDPTAIGDYPEAMDNYDLVPSGLIKLIKQGFNVGMDHSGTSIGQPTNFFVGAALNLCPPEPEQEIRNVQRKVRAGADFFITQPIYRPQDGPEFLSRLEARAGKLQKPVLVGILPLVSVKHANFLDHEVPGISIPDKTIRRLEQAGDHAAQEGVRLAVELIEQIRPWAQGVYIMPQFNRFDLIAEIIEQVKS